MKTATLSRESSYYYPEQTSSSYISTFFTWCKNQQENRLLWLRIVLAAHGCILTPITVLTVVASGNSLALFLAAIIAMGMALVTNLAAMPTKITLPAFFLSIVIDIALIIISIVNGLDITSTYI